MVNNGFFFVVDVGLFFLGVGGGGGGECGVVVMGVSVGWW